MADRNTQAEQLPSKRSQGRLDRKAKFRESKKRRVNGIAIDKAPNTLGIDAAKLEGPINAVSFAAARIHEIDALQSSIKKASFEANTIAFPPMHRTMRRRAASHILHGFPARMRAVKANKSANKGKTRTFSWRSSTFTKECLKGHHNQRWLETYMWHIKRMKMDNKWGYRLATHPMLKSYRVMYRAFTRFSMVHDASYYGCIEMTGEMDAISSVLDTITDPFLPSVGSARFKEGLRSGQTWIYQCQSYPRNLIAPISYLWRPTTTANASRALWIWVHPSAYNAVFSCIESCIKSKDRSTDIRITDLRSELVRFELTGPRSTELLQTILITADNHEIETNSNAHQVWKDMKYLKNACSLSSGVVLGLNVEDPRLRFPQKIPPLPATVPPDVTARLEAVIQRWPHDVANSDIWESNVRKHIYDSKNSDYSLIKRREQNLLPGTNLEFTSDDNRIPVLLIQRNNPIIDNTGNNQLSHPNMPVIPGWTVILPRGWGSAFWRSLIFAGAKVAGVNDVRNTHWESGFGSFPYDFPGTRAFVKERSRSKTAAEAIWMRKPVTKRVNYAKFKIDHPFECAFETLINTGSSTTSNQLPCAILLQGKKLITCIKAAEDTTTVEKQLQDLMGAMTAKRKIAPPAPFTLNDVLLKIRITYIQRGRPHTNALIYLLDDKEEYQQYVRSFGSAAKAIESNESADENHTSQQFSQSPRHIGYVTNGGFSLMNGCGFGVGACSAHGFRALLDVSQRSVNHIVLVRNPSSRRYYPAKLELMC
ncbi:NUC188 domain-containing protein [Radiomyces spectabilis]|uniref:NUC188 domain-containing protein n=1 Tax=Radiomyces spectabilis TaxID=64574 RepID=UPI002220A517|nr:NUC188 domain-containing protein [Radiomyces spectabilis]KAI8388722.1 NUC188 domain-containing protein [Radiomyces spectabilis]